MTGQWQKLGDIVERITHRHTHIVFTVPLQVHLAEALCKYADEEGVDSSTIIAEALRAYLGDAA